MKEEAVAGQIQTLINSHVTISLSTFPWQILSHSYCLTAFISFTSPINTSSYNSEMIWKSTYYQLLQASQSCNSTEEEILLSMF